MRCRATGLWRRVNEDSLMRVKKPCDGKVAEKTPLQDFSARPVLIGGDAVALYPSMDYIGTTEMVAKTIIESKVEFKNIDLKFLVVYLYLVLGENILIENDLGAYIPKRSKWVDSKAKSLSCQINRNMGNWTVSIDNI